MSILDSKSEGASGGVTPIRAPFQTPAASNRTRFESLDDETPVVPNAPLMTESSWAVLFHMKILALSALLKHRDYRVSALACRLLLRLMDYGMRQRCVGRIVPSIVQLGVSMESLTTDDSFSALSSATHAGNQQDQPSDVACTIWGALLGRIITSTCVMQLGDNSLTFGFFETVVEALRVTIKGRFRQSKPSDASSGKGKSKFSAIYSPTSVPDGDARVREDQLLHVIAGASLALPVMLELLIKCQSRSFAGTYIRKLLRFSRSEAGSSLLRSLSPVCAEDTCSQPAALSSMLHLTSLLVLVSEGSSPMNSRVRNGDCVLLCVSSHGVACVTVTFPTGLGFVNGSAGVQFVISEHAGPGFSSRR
jgi:hypothetical protein